MRVHRCFAFVDLSGFTALTEEQGDERAVAVLDDFRSLVRGICSRRGVRIAKWLGDGAMLVNLENAPVLGAVLEMLHAVELAPMPIDLRIGVASGEVILYEGDDYVGHCVNVAARLSDLAGGGEALAAPSVVESLPAWGRVTGTESVAVRGIGRPIEVSRLALWPPDGSGIPDPVCGIPLSRQLAVEVVVDRLGQEQWFCSYSCRDTWERRPGPATEDGSVRAPLIG